MELAVYELTGPLFFGAADRINQIEVSEVTRCLILRMRAVPSADSTAMNSMTALYERCKKNGVTLILSHVNDACNGESRIRGSRGKRKFLQEY
jgi:SulP family sulfate permease